MAWIVATVVVALVFLALMKVNFGPGNEGDTQVARGGGVALLVLWLIGSGLASAYTIEAGHIGLVKTFKQYTGQSGPGLHLKAPWQGVDEVNGRVQRQTITMNGGEAGSAVSKETQPVFAQLTVNYQVELDKARNLYTDVGEEYYRAIIEPRVQQSFKAITVKYATADIAPNREEIRAAAKEILTSQLEPYGIRVNDLLIKDLDFSDAFLHAIEDKQVAGQEALAATARVAKSKAEAEQRIADAHGKAESTRIEGQALQTNPEVLQLRAIEKLNPNVQVIYLPSDTKLFVNSPVGAR